MSDRNLRISLWAQFFNSIFAVIMLAQTVFAQNSNVVRVKATQPVREDGFGFVIYEKAGTLYLVTAKHVIQDQDNHETSDVVEIVFYNNNAPLQSVIDKIWLNLDLALLRIKKPDGFNWAHQQIAKTAKPGDKVWIIGRQASWKPTPKEHRGVVTKAGQEEVIANLSGVAPSSSGGPLVCKGGFCGMLITSDGNNITALPIELIRQKVFEWLKIKYQGHTDLEYLSLNGSDFPYFNMGMTVPFPYPATNPFGDDGTRENMQFWGGIPFGMFFEAALLPKYSVRFQGAIGTLKTKSVQVNDQVNQFKNNYKILTGSLLFYPDKSIGPGAERGLFFHLGYSLLKINPQMKINSGWTPLREMDIVDYPDSDMAYAITFGFGLNVFNQKALMYGLEMNFTRTTSRFMHADPARDLSANKQADWILSLELRIGYVLRPRWHNSKFMR